jgi:hypothetical protein
MTHPSFCDLSHETWLISDYAHAELYSKARRYSVSVLSGPIKITLPSLPSLAMLGMRVELRHVSSTISPPGRVGFGAWTKEL